MLCRRTVLLAAALLAPLGGVLAGCGNEAAVPAQQTTVAHGSATAATALYVSPRGDDSGPGTARAPLRTVNAALAQAAPGDTIRLAGGRYPQLQVSRAFPRPVTLARLGDARPVVAGARFLGAQGIVSEGVSYSDTVEITNHPVAKQRQPAQRIAIAGGEITTPVRRTDCMSVRNAVGVRIAQMRLHGCSTGIAGSYLGTDAARIAIVGNTIEDVNADGIHFGSWSDVKITDNVIRDMDDPANVEHNDGIQIYGNAHRVQIARNRISRSTDQLLLIQYANAGDNSDIAVTDNVIYDSGAYAVQIQASRDVSFIGNTVWKTKYGALIARPGGPYAAIQPTGLLIANNALETLALFPGTRATIASNVVGRRAGAPTATDPGFVDAAVGDFAPKPGSQLDGTGSAAFRTDTDVDGRPRAEQPSIGALEK